MGVAGVIFEPHPPNLVSDFRKSVWSVPFTSVAVLGIFKHYSPVANFGYPSLVLANVVKLF